MSLEIDTKAPKFESDTDGGGKLVLNELQGSWVILYFYPKDDTSGCTKEACSLNENLDILTKLNAIVIGVSPDPPSSHDKFKAKYNLNFKLVSDVDHKISESYNAWGEKSMYGRKYMGIIRSTFLIDPKGEIKHIFSKVNVNGHAEEIIKRLNYLISL
jgi:peroxiredoxin Q/BCP